MSVLLRQPIFIRRQFDWRNLMPRFLKVSFLVLAMVVLDLSPLRSAPDTSLISLRPSISPDDKPVGENKQREKPGRGERWLNENPIVFFKGDGKHGINSLAFSPDSKLLVAATQADKSTVRIWDLSEKKEKLSLKDDGMACWSVRFSSGGNLFMSASLGKNLNDRASLSLWDVSNWKRTKHFPLGETPAGACLTPDNKFTIAKIQGSLDRETPFGVAFFNNDNDKKEFDLLGHAQGIACFALSFDGTLLATGGEDKLVKVWDVKTRKELFSLSPDMERITALAFSSNNDMLAVGSIKNRKREERGETPPNLKLYDLAKLEEMNYIPPFKSRIMNVALCSGTPCLAILANSMIVLLNVKNGALLLIHENSYFTAISFSADGRLFAAGDHEGNIRVWKTVLPDFK
jgi:WD40 repeat protein